MRLRKRGQNPEEQVEEVLQPIGSKQLKNFTAELQRYNSDLNFTKQRIVASEQWWKLRNTSEEKKTSAIGKDGGFTSKSAWLHNVLVSKHADAMEAYPEPIFLPREPADRQEAEMLSCIVPCILEQNNFEDSYSNVMWQKLKTGTGVYKVTWDATKLNGLGDISIERANILNLFWEPEQEDIQKSKYFFEVSLVDKEELKARYPQLEGKLKGKTFVSARFLHDDRNSKDDKATVVEVYYHKVVDGKDTVQYCAYVEDVVLEATENMNSAGMYDHGLYPYVFDALYPDEGNPCGHGYVDVCKSPQTEIDLMKTAFVKNAMAGATPRYFRTKNSGVNEEQFNDLSKNLVDVNSIDERGIKAIEHVSLDSNYVGLLDRAINELRETSGNTETANGVSNSGVTAASALAILTEASGKGSRDSSRASYRAFKKVVEMVVELMRQFYDMPRKFRIMGENGIERYETYTNAGLKIQRTPGAFGQKDVFRKPVFDIKISAQKKNVYTRVSQNELALQFFKLGFFNTQLMPQVLMCLKMMDFEGKDEVIKEVSKNGTLQQKLEKYMQFSLGLVAKYEPDMLPGIQQDIMQTLGGSMPTGSSSVATEITQADNVTGLQKKEYGRVANAREQAVQASQPDSGRVLREETR